MGRNTKDGAAAFVARLRARVEVIRHASALLDGQLLALDLPAARASLAVMKGAHLDLERLIRAASKPAPRRGAAARRAE